MIGMRRNFIAALLFVIVLQAACSFRFDYVVVNSSNDPVTVEYRFKKLPGAEEWKKKDLLTLTISFSLSSRNWKD
jgi:hypothetical protein